MRVTDWLIRLVETPALREITFAVAQEPTTSCEDRVTLAWNDMQKVALVYDVENGTWDDRLPELMTAGCESSALNSLSRQPVTRLKRSGSLMKLRFTWHTRPAYAMH
ncbi:MAG: hypothetical protein G5703_04255 [Serratia symbiotica]|nr:hypothetical protein [Serratia symbiotica]